MRYGVGLVLAVSLAGTLVVRPEPATAAGRETVTADRIAAQLKPPYETKILNADQIAFQLSQRKSISISGEPVRRVDLPTVTFEHNSDRLTPQARAQLDELARALNYEDFRGVPFRVSGHTDATGTEHYNQGLSERRARAAMSYLASGHDLDPDKIEWVGLGESQPDPRYGPTAPEQRRVAIELSPEG